VESIPAAKNAWVQNIFDGVKEADRVMFKDDDATMG
jgi:hypothetical protein